MEYNHTFLSQNGHTIFTFQLLLFNSAATCLQCSVTIIAFLELQQKMDQEMIQAFMIAVCCFVKNFYIFVNKLCGNHIRNNFLRSWNLMYNLLTSNLLSSFIINVLIWLINLWGRLHSFWICYGNLLIFIQFFFLNS